MFEFKINDINLRVRAFDPFGNGAELIIYLERESGSQWQSLAYPSVYASDCETKESTDAAFQKALDQINTALEQNFGKGDNAPDHGLDRVRYLIANKLQLDGDKLVVVE